ncbi:hypothetical protein MKW94_022067 [Papaver nudicaule]|uniref:Uncharacterized protein n=1 Tax=Papaver nudicaule TaxID=74823 RepID=A0AA41RYT2_PAPNU|nr:hypothetical protein [Papaver nudicaule]
MIKVTVKESSVVKPAEDTPKVCLWTSNIDQLFLMHVQSVYFYKRPSSFDGNDKFFDSNVLKDGLSKALVPYYPVAGRLKRDEADKGRAVIDCNGEGVIFIEAETDSTLEDLKDDFAPTEQLAPLIPNLNDYNDVSSYPPFIVQVTHFKCGGVCLSTTVSHTIVDGVCGINFINKWSDLCRGLDIKSVPLFFDRTVLQARTPPVVSFPHIEHKPPSMDVPLSPKIAIAKLNISTEQASTLKSKCNNNGEFKFTTYEVIAGHLWRCSCKARELKDDQETMISMPVDVRSRLNPPLPDGYFGNAILDLTPTAKSGDIVTKPLSYAVNIIHETLKQGNDEYFRSALDFLQLHPNISALIKGPQTFKGCNIGNISWARLPIYEADFGWGKPISMGPGIIGFAGLSFLIPNPPGIDGGFSLILALEYEHQMNLFKEYFYDI